MTPKSAFLLNSGRDNNTQICFSNILNNKQGLVYGVLESTNDLRSISAGHIHFKKLRNLENLLKYFTVA